MRADTVIAIIALVASLVSIAAWIREVLRQRPHFQLVALSIALLVFSASTVYFWQRDVRHAEGRAEATEILSTLPCPEWGEGEAEELIGKAAAFFARHSDTFPGLAAELDELRAEVNAELPLDSVDRSYELQSRLERAASRAKGMLESASGDSDFC